MTKINEINWSQLFVERQNIYKKFGPIWRIPIAKRYIAVMESFVNDGMAVLELGGGQRQLEKKLQKLFHSITYRSFDIDRTNYHDYYQLDDIDGKYNIACMIEVIEHVRPGEALTMLNKMYDVLEDDGLAVMTTPNIYYPPEYLRDATHITPWCFDEMGAIVQLAGFEVINMYRLFSGNLKKKSSYIVYYFILLIGCWKSILQSIY